MSAVCTVEPTPVPTGPKSKRDRWSVMLHHADGTGSICLMRSRYEQSAERYAARVIEAVESWRSHV